MSTVIDYLRWYHESDATMDTAELAVAYAKHCLSEELREVWAIHKSEIDALKAQNAEVLAVAQTVVDADAETGFAIIAPSKEAFDKLVEDRRRARDAAIYRLKKAIAQARGDL